MKTKIQKTVMASLFASLCCVATMIIKIPSALNGYVNLGDCVVLLSGWILSPVYGFVAAGLGSALADVFSGYIIYAPATFVIKGLVALIAYGLFKVSNKKTGDFSGRIISGVAAEAVMVLGYYVFEGLLYGFIPSAVNILGNVLQGVVGLIIGIILVIVFEKNKIMMD